MARHDSVANRAYDAMDGGDLHSLRNQTHVELLAQ